MSYEFCWWVRGILCKCKKVTYIGYVGQAMDAVDPVEFGSKRSNPCSGCSGCSKLWFKKVKPLEWTQYAVDAVHSGCSGIIIYGGGDIVFGTKMSNQWMQWI